MGSVYVQWHLAAHVEEMLSEVVHEVAGEHRGDGDGLVRHGQIHGVGSKDDGQAELILKTENLENQFKATQIQQPARLVPSSCRRQLHRTPPLRPRCSSAAAAGLSKAKVAAALGVLRRRSLPRPHRRSLSRNQSLPSSLLPSCPCARAGSPCSPPRGARWRGPKTRPRRGCPSRCPPPARRRNHRRGDRCARLRSEAHGRSRLVRAMWRCVWRCCTGGLGGQHSILMRFFHTHLGACACVQGHACAWSGQKRWAGNGGPQIRTMSRGDDCRATMHVYYACSAPTVWGVLGPNSSARSSAVYSPRLARSACSPPPSPRLSPP